ncbi:MAG: Imidazole glycerol phosphate synthase amidotransferase subunit [uncultured Thermomicrobiales bacterium]|uniref:Imidazole glycerol phosphate synthase subunit HisH n=1 Tax=uncultured Thermomicrobiales bacterium TaxID=1645740 RepID=A0A6J4UPU7_9BACT|nr:MAG: Imidazole glycerol phosphate synthase amidotransferase subunit [uncultured Thermomicrobiales bacterium]
MIAVIDYGAGNLGSVVNALTHLGVPHVVTDRAETIAAADGTIFPGVGATADTMSNLRARGLVPAIAAATASGRPFLGICVGHQVLFSTSDEGPRHDCLDILRGAVRRFSPDLIVPHMGWNGVRRRREHPLFAGIPDGAEFYFVHSYYVAPADDAIVLGETEYGAPFASVIAQGPVVATQFHPEKSGRWGLRLLRNFAGMVDESAARRPGASGALAGPVVAGPVGMRP